MYKGKFDQKTKGGNVQDILAQRNQPAPEEMRKPKKPQSAPQQRPASETRAPQKTQSAPRQAVSKQPAKPQKRSPRLGGVIFYTLYFLFILLFFIATFVGLLWLRGWLKDFEASQPTVKSQQVFTQLFTDPDWDALYQASGAKDSPFEGKDAFVSYMEEKVGTSPLSFLETSAGLSGNKKYFVRLDNENVASFTLVDKNRQDGDKILENITELPDWQLGAVEVFFQRSGSYRIEKVADHIAYVNDVPLDDSFTIQKATTKAEDFLPVGVTSAKMYTQEVTGLMSLPTVTIFDKQGNQKEVTYDEATRTFTERTEANSMTEEERELIQKTAETYCLYMIEKAQMGDIAKYFDHTSDIYKTIASFQSNRWMQNSAGHEFANLNITKYERYSDELFSARVVMDLNVTRNDGSVKVYPYDNTLFFRKTDAGKWKAFEMVNVDVSAPVGKIRLTFMNGEDMVHTDFFETGADHVITPILPVPEGKVFSGWVRKDVNANGVTELTLVFRPDETGKAIIPDGTDLEPMTLFALFEDADKVSVPETTEGAE